MLVLEVEPLLLLKNLLLHQAMSVEMVRLEHTLLVEADQARLPERYDITCGQPLLEARKEPPRHCVYDMLAVADHLALLVLEEDHHVDRGRRWMEMEERRRRLREVCECSLKHLHLGSTCRCAARL